MIEGKECRKKENKEGRYRRRKEIKPDGKKKGTDRIN